MSNEMQLIPSWLKESPAQISTVPVQTRLQELPFGELTWENFERLCLRLVKAEAEVEHCQLYGVRGDDQEGIDIYARKRQAPKYSAYQCKREKKFGPAQIKKAIDRFLEGEWVSRSEIFVLCTQEQMSSKERANEFRRQSERLKKHGISLFSWDKEELSTKLKNYPDIIEDFFNEWYAKALCGSSRPSRLREIEKAAAEKDYKLWVLDRTSFFSIPTIHKQFSIADHSTTRKVSCIQGDNKAPFELNYITDLYQHCIIIGDSGSGKSLAIQQFANHLTGLEKIVLLVRLPEVMSLYQEGKTFEEAILSCSTDGLNASQSVLSVIKEPDYLLADGLDECRSERTDAAAKLQDWASGHKNTKIVVSNRNGYESELLVLWEKVELQPLDTKSVLKLAENLLSGIVLDSKELERNISSLEETLQDKILLPLASASPLFLGFLICLSISGIDVKEKSKTELYKEIIDLSFDYTLQSRKFDYINKRRALRIFTIAGWKLMCQPSITEHDLAEEIIQELEAEGFSQYEAENTAEQGIRFWEYKRVFNRIKSGYKSQVGFIHPSLCEYAAGFYASTMNEANLKNWLESATQDIRWKDTIRFASSLCTEEKIAECLISLCESNSDIDPNFLLAAIEEHKNPSIKTIQKIINQLILKLRSADPNNVSRAVNVLLQILSKSPQLTPTALESLANSKQLWTRTASMRIALTHNKENVQIDKLTQLIGEILGDWKNPDSRFPTNLMSLFMGRQPNGWHMGSEVIVLGCQLLLEKERTIDTARKIKAFISPGCYTADTFLSLSLNLESRVKEEMFNEASSRESRIEWVSFWQDLHPPSKYLSDTSSYFSEQLAELRRLERSRHFDKIFLEGIVRATSTFDEEAEAVILLEKPVAIGILFSGMAQQGTTERVWELICKHNDKNAVDTVIRGLIIALAISPKRLKLEAERAIRDIDRFFSFDLKSIKDGLEKGKILALEDAEISIDSIERLKKVHEDEKASYQMLRQIPRVPVVPRWELVSELQLSPSDLARALTHPSDEINQNAGLLIKHGAGGEEAVQLAKKTVGEDIWKTFSSADR